MLENDFYTQDALKINRKCVSNDLNIIVWPLSRIPVYDAVLLCSKTNTMLYKYQVDEIIINSNTFSKSDRIATNPSLILNFEA